MVKIFQRFDLSLDDMAQLGHEELQRLNLPQAGRTLREQLSIRGYVVFESNGRFGGVPNEIILGGDINMNHKQDFYELAQRLGLKYCSGSFYAQHTLGEEVVAQG